MDDVVTSELRYRALVEATMQVTWSMDEHGRLVRSQSSDWLELTGQANADAGDTDWLACVHPEERAAAARAWERALAAGDVFERELPIRDSSGRYLTMSVRCVPVRDDDGRILEWIGAANDVTGARAADRLVRVRARQQLEVADLGRFALTGASVDEVLGRALEIAVDTLDADSAAVLEMAPSGEELVLRATHGWESAPIGSGTTRSDSSLAGLTLTTDGPVVADDVRADPRFEPSDLLRQTGAASAVTTVIRGTPRPWGIIGVLSAIPRRFSLDDASFLRAIANVLASAIQRSASEEAVRASEARLRLALEAGQLGTWDRTLATGRLSWSPAVEEIFGLEPGSFGGTEEAFQALVHPSDLPRVRAALAATLAGEAPYDVEYRCVRPDGTIAWISSQGQVLRDANGRPVRMVGLVQDATERKRHEEALVFLAEASEALSGSLDLERTLNEVARLAVPRLADGCIIDVLEQGYDGEQVTVVHTDAEQELRILELERRYPTSGKASYVGRVMAGREPKLVRRVDEAFLADVAQDAEHLEHLRQLGLRSVLFAPLRARGRTFGVITLFTDRSGRRLGPDDLVLATDLARHAALAIDNARLYRQRSHVASTLQRSLLPPELPRIPGVELAARYRPFAAGVEVGGDFYDAFPLGVDTYGIVIGDVCGKGPEAAAVTGLARHTVRAASAYVDAPADVLGRLNQAVYAEYDGLTFCTVVYGRIEPFSHQLRLRLSSGGHPLPLHLRASGAVEPVGAFGTLVGVFPSAEFDDAVVPLEPGDAVLLYTDGLAEGLAGQLALGEQRLLALLAESAGLSADEIATRIEDAISDAGESADRDDIAFLVVRVLEGPSA